MDLSSDIWCQICGTSTNISRIRRPDEPFEASWCADDLEWSGEPLHATYVPAIADEAEECRNCLAATVADGFYSDSGSYFSDDGSCEVESFEYATPPDSETDHFDGEDEHPRQNIPAGEPRYMTDRSDEGFVRSQDTYHRFLSSLPGPTARRSEALRPLTSLEQQSYGEYEHIAGKDCRSNSGYNGHRISAEEMKGCTTVQFLVPKTASWRPEEDDEDFERCGDFHLSGLTDHLRRRDARLGSVFPPRHGCRAPEAENCLWWPGQAGAAAMPFHPYCLEVYKRASLRRWGAVDMKALMAWFRLDGNPLHFMEEFPRHEAVHRGRQKQWRHIAGDEWLAANPCFVPDLEPILSSVQTRCSAGLGMQSVEHAEPRVADCFVPMPAELRMGILSHLSGRDVASTCLASGAFRRLPQSFFRKLLLRDMPWLWEAWCPLPLSCWATTTRSELEIRHESWDRQQRDIEEWQIPVLEEEGGRNGGNEAAIVALRARLAAIEEEKAEFHRSKGACLLPMDETDWLRLYVEMARRCDSLKGIRNRARIWADCEHILARIEIHRAEGRTGSEGVVDPDEVCRAFFRAYPELARPIVPRIG